MAQLINRNLILISIVAAFFFSSTFIINRFISVNDGFWVRTADLRYFFTAIILFAWLLSTGGLKQLSSVWNVFAKYWVFWIVAGTIGFGIFYAGVAFSSVYAPAWVVAATWQLNILATIPVLILFGKKPPVHAFIYSLMVFIGILLVNVQAASSIGITDVLLSAIPVFIGAFAYPIGAQLVGEAKNGTTKWLPHIQDKIMDDAAARVFLMTLGSIPFWILLEVITRPPPSPMDQLVGTFLVALFSGVIATSLFWLARHKANSGYEIAAIDATSSFETVFVVLIEVAFLGTALPGLIGLVGILLIVGGICLYTIKQAD